ncbi:MAG: AraC family transcriptional regulator [Burkholderiales bacterium]|nr:AraC family transcriptional regulator [Burkholderiales bacterium]
MDALSEALSSVRMTGAIFYRAECTSPWGVAIPPLREYAHLVAPGTGRVVSYHLMTEGDAVARFGDGQEVLLAAGDVLIVPHGDPHVISNGPAPTIVEAEGTLGPYFAGDLSTLQIGGGGEVTRLVCGFFGCERHADRLFLSGLPMFIRINLRDDVAGQWLEHSIRHLVTEAGGGRPGRSVLLSKMAEALFIEALRRYMEQLPAEQTGWLAAARDEIVGAAITAIHRAPGHAWTLESLAEKATTSRSVLTERFARFLGESPLAYLAMWRMQLAARRLQTSRDTVLKVALEVGYESEAAFIRAFKREFGLPPARYRKQIRS